MGEKPTQAEADEAEERKIGAYDIKTNKMERKSGGDPGLAVDEPAADAKLAPERPTQPAEAARFSKLDNIYKGMRAGAGGEPGLAVDEPGADAKGDPPESAERGIDKKDVWPK